METEILGCVVVMRIFYLGRGCRVKLNQGDILRDIPQSRERHAGEHTPFVKYSHLSLLCREFTTTCTQVRFKS